MQSLNCSYANLLNRVYTVILKTFFDLSKKMRDEKKAEPSFYTPSIISQAVSHQLSPEEIKDNLKDTGRSIHDESH